MSQTGKRRDCSAAGKGSRFLSPMGCVSVRAAPNPSRRVWTTEEIINESIRNVAVLKNVDKAVLGQKWAKLDGDPERLVCPIRHHAYIVSDALEKDDIYCIGVACAKYGECFGLKEWNERLRFLLEGIDKLLIEYAVKCGKLEAQNMHLAVLLEQLKNIKKKGALTLR